MVRPLVSNLPLRGFTAGDGLLQPVVEFGVLAFAVLLHLHEQSREIHR